MREIDKVEKRAEDAMEPEPGPGSMGRVGAPRALEATSSEFHFWVADDQLVEKTQLVHAESPAGGGTVTHFGLVTEVFRQSRRQSMLEESDRFDGRPDEAVPLEARGVTYAHARVIATQPKIFTAPQEEAVVYAAGEDEARVAYGVDEMGDPLVVGLVRNGGSAVAGPAYIDLDYLLGSEGGHMNVTGIAGVGTKSSFLTVVMNQVVRASAQFARAHPSDHSRVQVLPVILNVKGFDLFWLDHWSSSFTREDAETWRRMGWDNPTPLAMDFYAPQRPGSDDLPIPIGRDDVQPYSWSLADIVTSGLFTYLFNDSDREDDNFALLVADIERLLMEERRNNNGRVERSMRENAVAGTFQGLFDWFEQNLQRGDDDDELHVDAAFARLQGVHHGGTIRRFYRRLRRVVYESAGIFRLGGSGSHPLRLHDFDPGRPVLIDIHGVPDRHLQRFVVAALLDQAVTAQTGPQALAGMHYLFVLDELNRFAPKGAKDPITRLIETVAAELRSRGIILLGAQQQGSLVSTRVVENASIRVLGRTGGHELRQDIYSFLRDEGLKDYVERLEASDKVVNQPKFGAPMNIKVPRPPWAMRRQEATSEPPDFLEEAHPVVSGPRRIRPRPFDEL